jgi:hypothetical protein
MSSHGSCCSEPNARASAAGDKRAGPAGAGTGHEQRRAEPLLDLRRDEEVALVLLVALEGRDEHSERHGDRAP